MAELAVQLARPGIESLLVASSTDPLDEPLCNKAVIAIAVMEAPIRSLGEVLYQTRFVLEESKWNRKYAQYAAAKAQLAARERMDTSAIINGCPQLLQPGDITFPGGVYADGIAVGASGVQGYFDEMIARIVLDICRGLCKHGAALLQKAESPYVE